MGKGTISHRTVYVINHRSHIAPAGGSTSTTKEATISNCILVGASAAAAVLPFLPFENVGRNRIPKIFSNGRQFDFHAFILCLMFAFSGAFSALVVEHRPKTARFCRYLSIVSAAAAVSFVFSSLASRKF